MIELLMFRLAAGVAEQEFLDADKRVQTEFFYAQPGLMRRMTARGVDGEWLVLTLWGSERDADAAVKAAEGDPIAQEFNEKLEMSSVVVKRYMGLD